MWSKLLARYFCIPYVATPSVVLGNGGATASRAAVISPSVSLPLSTKHFWSNYFVFY